MKNSRILRMFGIVLILSLLLMSVPATPALAVESITLSPTQVKVGDRVNYTGAGYATTGTQDYYVDIYVTDQTVTTSSRVDYEITRYKRVYWATPLELGTFSGYFIMPTTLNEGTTGAASPLTVTAGTCYVFSTTRYYNPEVKTINIAAVTTLTIISSGTITITPTSGPVDTAVRIIGTGFIASTAITVKYDGTSTVIDQGDIATKTNGSLDSTIRVPDSTAGTHNITVTVGSGEVSAVFTVTPDILITPQSGESGATVLISGTGFGRRVVPTIYFNNFPVETLSPVITDTSGTFSASFLVPGEGLAAGVYQVEADDDSHTATASFTLNVPPPVTPTPEPTPTPTPTPVKPALTINASGDTIGSNIVIGGSGFTPKATVTIKYDDTEVATATASADGVVMAIFEAPPSQHGDHTITVSDGTNTNTVTFTVESVAPATPPPLLPEMGSKVKSPVTFDWEDVTDDSQPVTYVLQVAIDKGFPADSIVWEKTDIKASAYTLTEAEELKLAGRQDAFYWRVKAVDAASNEGAWTGAGEFYFGGSAGFFPSWALYTLIGVGGVLLFGLGYWLGRRTAFYY